MSNTADRLDTAAFPEDYADILIETLGITAANYLGVKDALNHYRRLDDDEAAEVMRQIAEHEDAIPSHQPRLIEKRLASSGLFHTPGFFRALQNDYRIKGDPRRRAVRILSEGYGLPYEEAEGLLSGVIAIVIDEAAGTLAYTAAHPESSTN